MWVFTGGAILVLLQSIVSGAKRRWFSLLIGCLFGGIGAMIGWGFFQGFEFGPYATAFLAGVAAVISENVLAGVVNASKQFADSPLAVFTHLFRTIVPAFGKSTGDTSGPIDTSNLK
jgi:hypothetical protein